MAWIIRDVVWPTTEPPHTTSLAGVEAPARKNSTTPTLLDLVRSKRSQIGFFPSRLSSRMRKRCTTAPTRSVYASLERVSARCKEWWESTSSHSCERGSSRTSKVGRTVSMLKYEGDRDREGTMAGPLELGGAPWLRSKLRPCSSVKKSFSSVKGP